MADHDDGPSADPHLESLTARYKQEGLDLQFICEPFLEAAELGNPSQLRQRLESLAPDERRAFLRSVDQQGRAALLLAVQRGDTDLASVLLDAGANPNDADSTGSTALHCAAGRGAAPILQLLLEGRADVERKDDRGDTPLMWAVGERVVALLLEARADAGARDCTGKTALIYASGRGDLEAIPLLARAPGMDLGAKDSRGFTAHATAVAAGCWDAAELLVSLGAAAAEEPPGSQTNRVLLQEEALHEAAGRDDAGALAALLRAGCAPDAEVDGETALLVAASAGAASAADVLLQARADPNHADAFLKETPLARALLGGGACELLWLLLEARANPSQADLAGRTPCDLAAMYSHHRGAELLRAAAAGCLDLGLD